MFKKWFKRKNKSEEQEVLAERENTVEEQLTDDHAESDVIDSDAQTAQQEIDGETEQVTTVDSEQSEEQRAEDDAAAVEETIVASAEALVAEPDLAAGDLVDAEPIDRECGADRAAERSVEECAEEEQVVDGADEEVKEEKVGFFKKLFKGLDKTRKNITENIDRMVNNYDEIDDDLFEELEEILITADIGMNTALALVEELKKLLVERRISDPSLVKDALKDVLIEHLSTNQETALATESPTVILVIGVNGAGKTTSIGKIGNLLKNEGKTVILAAADTFRAAAIDQLKVWADRAGLPVVAHSEGSDPAAVVFDACQSAKAKNADVLIIDTAGRLHNKVNLMNELNKIFRIVEREFGDAKKEVLLVLDATTGQNALQQAKLFKETAPISGLVVTKLDGTAKGGFVFAIKRELGIPVKLIGVGEKIDDLQHFDAADFARALMQS